jgi:hypothetical protein
MRSRLGTWTSTAASAGRRLPKRCRETQHARSLAVTGGSITADITRGPERVPSPGTSMLAPCPATRCATATSTRWRTACSCSCGTLPMTISWAGLIGNWGRWIPNLLTGSCPSRGHHWPATQRLWGGRQGLGDGLVVAAAGRRQATAAVVRSRRNLRGHRHPGP